MRLTATSLFAISVSLIAAASFGQQPPTYEIRFTASIGDRPLVCGERYANVGASKSSVTLADLRFYVMDVQLVRADGQAVRIALEQDGIWQQKNLALLDFEDGSGSCNTGTKGMRQVVRGTAPVADYRGVRFTLGVPAEMNHADPTLAASPLNLTAMFWSWQAGYKFLKLDLAPAPREAGSAPAATSSAPSATGFVFHVGSTGCVGGSRAGDPPKCANGNRVVVDLPGFVPQTNVVHLDLAALLANTELDKNTPKTSPGCMAFPGDPDCDQVMTRLGLSYGALPAQPQVLFSVRTAN